jgi:hypothetical protein
VVVARGRCELGIINVNTGAASSTVSVYDDVTAVTANLIAVIDASVEGCYVYAGMCSRGITVVMAAGDSDITVSFA